MERREDCLEWGEAGRSLRWAREVAIRKTGDSRQLPRCLLSPAPRSERDKKFELPEIRCQWRGISVGMRRGAREREWRKKG